CKLPGRRELSLTVNDETGASTPEGDVRAFAGLRCDPFYIGLDTGTLEKVPNQLQHNNVLCKVVEFDTRRILDPTKGSLFGTIAEPIPRNSETESRLQLPASTGSDAQSTRTLGSTIPGCQGSTIYATCGISRLRSRFQRTCSQCF